MSQEVNGADTGCGRSDSDADGLTVPIAWRARSACRARSTCRASRPAASAILRIRRGREKQNDSQSNDLPRQSPGLSRERRPLALESITRIRIHHEPLFAFCLAHFWLDLGNAVLRQTRITASGTAIRKSGLSRSCKQEVIFLLAHAYGLNRLGD